MSLSNDETLVYRPLREADLPSTHALSQAVRWPHRLEDWQFVWRVSEARGEVVEDDGKVVAVAMHVDYGTCGTLGLIIVSPEQQGKRIGSALVERALAQLSAPAAMLNATAAGAGVYTRYGFANVDELVQHQGSVGTDLPDAVTAMGESLRPVGSEALATLHALDARATGMDRAGLLEVLVDVGQTVLLMRDEIAVGYAVMRPFGRGQVIGPVVAPDLAGAKVLVRHFLAGSAGQFVRVDTRVSTGLGGWLAEAGLAQVDRCAVMGRGELPRGDGTTFTFALSTQALG